MGWKKCDYTTIINLKKNYILELPWYYPDEGEVLWKYECNNDDVAYMRLSLDPLDKHSIWIDEFEVLREKRKAGIGKRAILEFLNEVDADVKLLAKNKQVQLFWEKCGFEDDGITWTEVPMIFRVK